MAIDLKQEILSSFPKWKHGEHVQATIFTGEHEQDVESQMWAYRNALPGGGLNMNWQDRWNGDICIRYFVYEPLEDWEQRKKVRRGLIAAPKGREGADNETYLLR